MKLSDRYGATKEVLHNLEIISDFITVNFFLFLCSLELNSFVILKLFMPPEGSTSVLEGFKRYIGFDGNFIVSFIVRTVSVIAIFMWAIICKLTVGTIVVWIFSIFNWFYNGIRNSNFLKSRYCIVYILLTFKEHFNLFITSFQLDWCFNLYRC
jgi:hypothetical protein